MMDFSKRLKICAYVLLRPVGEGAILLNVQNKQYYSLDDIGKRMVQMLEESESIEQAFNHLLDEYMVDPVALRSDLQDLAEKLLQCGLLEAV